MPQLQIAALRPKQDRLRSKIGGVPWGLPPHWWPTCCGHPQKLLGQFCHEPPMIDLGEEGAVLHLFQCLECLGLVDDSSRAAFIVDDSELSQGLVTIPGYDDKPDLGERLIGEVWIDGWEANDDGIPTERLNEFLTWETWSPLLKEFPDVRWFEGREATRFGGSPRWTGNGPGNFPPPPFEFLLQLDSGLYFKGDPPTPDEAGCPLNITEVVDGRGSHFSTTKPDVNKIRLNSPWHITQERFEDHYWVEYTNLGTDGVAYVFIDRTKTPNEVRWFWNR